MLIKYVSIPVLRFPILAQYKQLQADVSSSIIEALGCPSDGHRRTLTGCGGIRRLGEAGIPEAALGQSPDDARCEALGARENKIKEALRLQ